MIVVTAPTSAIGHQVLENFLANGEPIRVVVRDPSRLPADIRERVEVVQGAHGDSDVVSRAFTNADAVFWLVPPNPRSESVEAAYLDFTRPACVALERQGGFQAQGHRTRDVRGARTGDERHDAGQRSGSRQRRTANPREHDADQFSPVVRRGANTRGSRLTACAEGFANTFLLLSKMKRANIMLGTNRTS
jgi:hypothetical protein